MFKINQPNSDNKIFAKNGTYAQKNTMRHLCTKFDGFIFIYDVMIAKKWLWPTFGCKVGQSDPIGMKLKLNMLCPLMNVYKKFTIDISKHVEKSLENSDRQTDRWTMPWHNTTIFQMGVKKLHYNSVKQ